MEPVLTVGHSNRSGVEFRELLEAHGVQVVLDVRRYPGSRRYPQFGRESLREELAGAGIGYLSLPELGGRRAARPDSVNTAWQNEGFRGYADYMQTAEFAAGLERLMEEARGARVAIMCAEAVPWQCHRQLIADALAARGVAVEHILSKTRVQQHEPAAFARMEDGRVTYPGLDAAGGVLEVN